MDITLERTTQPRPRPAQDQLGFGGFFTDHMFMVEYESNRGWHNARVLPYGPLSIEPSAASLQYGQTLFEGMKAYAGTGGEVRVFRPDVHARRLNRTADRLCMPRLDPELFMQGLRKLLETDRDWLPTLPGTSLYVRPTMIATEAFLGVRPANRYVFLILLSPVGNYWHGPPHPLKIWLEQHFVRAAPGGTGEAKTGGNYAASLMAAQQAKAKGWDQVLWLDATHRRYVEEVGTMNVAFRIGDEVVTPPLGGTILPGVTRDSALDLLRDWGVPAVERQVSIDELRAAHSRGRLTEAFGLGTAAVISPIGELGWDEVTLTLPAPPADSIAQRLRTAIEGIQRGELPDAHNWVLRIP